MQLDRGDRDVAVDRRGPRERGGGLDRWMLFEHALDLRWKNLEAVQIHHIIGATVQADSTFGSQRCEVAADGTIRP